MPQVIGAIGIAVAASVGGAAVAAAVSLSALTAFAIGAATIVAAGMLANKIIANLYEMPTMDTDQSRQSTVKSTVEPQKIIYGETLVSGPIAFIGVAGPKNRDLYHAVVLAGHEVNAITDIHFDNQVIPSASINGSGNVTSGLFGPKGGDTICKINKKLGAAGQTADADLSATFASVGANHKGTGIAYIVTKWTLIGDSQEVWDQYTPQNIKALVQGRKVYDYRLDDELVKPNVNDPDFIAYSTNPVWCLIDYLINTDFGMSVNPNRIDWDAAVVAADACDATVSVPGGVEKRFTCNGVLFGTDTHKTNINKLLSSMNGILSYTNGQFVIRAGAYEAPSVSLDEDSLSGAVSVKTSVERSDRFNTVTGVFIDPSQNYKSTEFPEVFTTAARSRDNDEILTKEIQLPMTNSRFMAQRIANKLVQQSDQQKVVTFPTNLSGMEVAVGDRVSVSLDEFNWSNKVFLCLGWTLSDSGNGGVNLILREDDSGSYADPAVGEYSTISATGALIEGFRGVPDPSNLSATAGLKSIELNWTNPDNMSDVLFVEVFASPNSSWANRVKIGEVNGTQFFHDGSTTADPLDIGDERYYWVRARAYSTGEDATAVSDRNPDNDTSTINATVGGVDYDDVVGDAKPEDNATVGATIGTDLFNIDGSTVLNAVDVLNQVLEDQILNVQIEIGEVLDLETGQDVAIQNLGDVAIFVNESNQLLNTNIGSLNNAFSNLENTIVDLTSGVSDVYVQDTAPVAGVGSIPDPIPTFSRWYDSDDSNEPYYWDGTEWVSLADPRIASNASSITTLQSGLNTANSNISGNSTAIDVLDTTTISQGNSISSLSSDVTTLQSELNTAEGDIITSANAVSGLTTRVTTAEDEITSQASDITTLETTVNDPTTGVTASATAISGLDTRVTANEDSITSQASQTTVLNASLSDLVYIQDESDSIIETEAGDELLLNLTTNVATATSEIVQTLDSRVVATEGGVASQSQAITTLQSDLSTVDNEQQATANAVSALTTRVIDAEGDITSTASSLTALSSTVTDPTTGLAATASVAQGANTLAQTIDGEVTSLQAEAYLTVSAGGNVAGFKATADSASSNFTIQADRFALVSTNEGQTTVPFVVNGTTGLVGFTANVVIDGDLITNGTISTDKIAANAVTASKIATETITANQIAANAVTAAKIAVGTITANEIAANAVTSAKILANAVTSDKITAGSISTDKIAANAITADKIEVSSIASAVIQAGSIVVDGDTDVDLSLTGGAAGPVTITSTSLYQGTGTFNNTNTGFYLDSTGQFSLKDRLSFDGTNLSLSGSVTAAAFTLSSGATLVDPSDQISNENNNAFFRYTTTAAGGDVSAPNDTEFNNVFGRNPRLRDVLVVINTASSPEVGAAYIYNGTAWVLEDNFITGDLIVDGTITADKIDVTNLSAINSNLGAIIGGSININNSFIVTNTGGLTATSANINGDITAQNLNISNATVTGTLSADAIQIDGVTLDTDGSGNLIIRNGGVSEEKIATDAVTADKIAAGTITANEIAAGTITANEIAAGTITAAEIAADAITADKINVTDLSAISATLGTVTAGTFKTAESGFRVEISDTGDFPIWYGTGAKTAQNGLFYVDAEGEVYINAIIVARAGSTVAIFKASVAPIIKIGFTSSITTDAAVVTISNGTGAYNYSWTRQITTQGPTPTISNSTSASPTFTATGMQVGIDSTSIWEVVVTDTTTSETATAQAYVTIVRDA